MEYWTSQEVALIEGVTSKIAQRWAVKNNVKRLSDRYLWTKEDLAGFQNRNKVNGRPKK